MNETNISKFHKEINNLLNEDFDFENIKYNLIWIIILMASKHLFKCIIIKLFRCFCFR